MTSILRFLSALWGLLMGWATGIVQWIRKPGSLMKSFCAVLAFGCLVSGLTAYEREQRIQELSAEVVRVRADWRADSTRLQADVDARDARLAEVATALRAEADKLERLREENARALNDLADKIEASERDAMTWKERYEDRPDTCKAALELLDSACPALKGY